MASTAPSAPRLAGTAAGRGPRRPRLASFLAIYLAIALLFELGGATPSWGPSSPLEAFSAGLFGMLALLAFVLARRTRGVHRVFWGVSLLALAALGLDEGLDLHEVGNTVLASDHWKVLLWLGAAASLATVHWLERPSRGARRAMLAGYAAHTLYLVFEVGDGAYFQLPMAEALRGLLEESCEVLMLSAYLVAFGAIASEQGVVAAELHEPGDRRSAA